MIATTYTREQFDKFLSGMKYPPNPFQLAVLESIAFGSGNITVDAKAGSGKTSLLKMIASLILDMGVEPSDVIFQAFNKSIEEELNAQLPKGFTAKTSHSLGLSMCREYAAANGIKLGKLSDKKYKDIAKEIAERIHPGIDEEEKRFKAVTTVSKLIGFIMANDVDPDDLQAVEELALHYALEVTPAMVMRMSWAIGQAIERFQKFGEMDFIDMIYMPVKLKMEPKFRYRYVLCDECQDLNSLQQEISAKLLHPEGRIIVVGDVNQSIYAFSGADSQAFYNLQKRFNTQILELNICYRCPTSHIEVAQSLVPTIEAAPNAIEGAIEFKHLDTLASMPLGSMVICRLNAPLFASYFQFIAQEKPAVIIGRDMGKGLVALVDKIADMEGFRYYNISHFIERYYDLEEAKLEKKPNAASKIAQLSDQVACLKVCVENFDCDDLDCFKAKLEALFVDFKDKNLDKSKVVTLCTVHRAKGLEAEHIGLIYQRKNSGDEFSNIMPLVWEKQRAWELEQEYNIKYVALTRSKHTLTVFGGYKPGQIVDLTEGNSMELVAALASRDSRAEEEQDEYFTRENQVYNYPGEALEDDEEDEMEEPERTSVFALAEQSSNGHALLESLNETIEEAKAPTLSIEAAADALYAPIQPADFVEKAAGTTIPVPELFIYGMSRPAMYGTCPDDYVKDSALIVAANNLTPGGFYVDTVVYLRKLNRDEMERYELQPVSENAWDVQIGDKVFTTGRIEYVVMEHLKNGKVVIEVEVDGRKVSQIEHQWDLTPVSALATGLGPKPAELVKAVENSSEGEKVAEVPAPASSSEAIPTEPVAWAKWMLEHKERVVILDTETTDLPIRPNNFEIIQLSIINLNGETLFSKYIKPRQATITKEAAATHKITDSKLAYAGYIGMEIMEIKQAIEGKHIIAFNSPFDKGALENSLKLSNRPMIEVAGWHDAMRVYTKHNPTKPNKWGKLGANWSLVEAVAQQGLPVDENAHDALADVRMLLALIKSMAADSPDRWQAPKALPAPKEIEYKVDDRVRVKASGVIGYVKKIMPSGELSISDENGANRQTLSAGMIEPAPEEKQVESPIVEQAREVLANPEPAFDVRHMDLNGRQVRLSDGTEAEVIEANGDELVVQPEGKTAPLEVSRNDLFSVITTPVAEAPKDTFSAIESLVRKTGNREAALAMREAVAELLLSVIDEVHPA